MMVSGPGVSDHAMLATVVTCLLIRMGGAVNLTDEEWLTATEQDVSLWIHRDQVDPGVLVGLIRRDSDARDQ